MKDAAINQIVQQLSLRKGAESAFPIKEYDQRIANVRVALVDRGIDVLIVTGPENLFYLTGFQTPGYATFQALLLPVDGDAVFFLRLLELGNLTVNTYIDKFEIYQDDQKPSELLIDTIHRMNWQNLRIGIDKQGYFLPIAFYEALSKSLRKLEDGSGIVEKFRQVKSLLELEKIRQAAIYRDAAMRAGISALAEGVTENDIVSKMMGAGIAAGSEYMGMDPQVASGPRSGIAHVMWRRRKLEKGDCVILEPACCHDRYHAPIMRTAWIGKVPDDARHMMDVCQEGLQATLNSIKPGTTCETVHNTCQKIIDRYGYTENFRKRVGYSVGIAFAPGWDEGSILSLYTGVKTELQPGMVFHLPVALRKYGKFTVGVSEFVIVTKSGCEILGNIDRALVVV